MKILSYFLLIIAKYKCFANSEKFQPAALILNLASLGGIAKLLKFIIQTLRNLNIQKNECFLANLEGQKSKNFLALRPQPKNHKSDFLEKFFSGRKYAGNGCFCRFSLDFLHIFRCSFSHKSFNDIVFTFVCSFFRSFVSSHARSPRSFKLSLAGRSNQHVACFVLYFNGLYFSSSPLCPLHLEQYIPTNCIIRSHSFF